MARLQGSTLLKALCQLILASDQDVFATDRCVGVIADPLPVGAEWLSAPRFGCGTAGAHLLHDLAVHLARHPVHYVLDDMVDDGLHSFRRYPRHEGPEQTVDAARHAQHHEEAQFRHRDGGA